MPQAFGKYELLERVGRGGMAEVYKARLPGISGFEKTLVIKRLHPRFNTSQGFVQMFIEEAKLAAQVQHKNVVQVFELDRLDNGELFIAMEYIDGVDLKGLIRAARLSESALPIWFGMHAVVEILDALSYAHAMSDEHDRPRNIVHNDVTPENIFVAKHGDIKLGDFGVAHDDSRASDPFPGQMKGKIPYMSPEQLAGTKPDARSDVFAAGIVLWETLTQRHLFHAPTQSETMARICGAARVPPSHVNPQVPKALDDVVMAALETDRDRRLSSAKAFQSALLEVLDPLKGRVDLTEVRNIVQPVLHYVLGPGDPFANDLPIEFEIEEVPEDDLLAATAMSASEAAMHLASPTATGEFPALTAEVVKQVQRLDVIKEPPALMGSGAYDSEAPTPLPTLSHTQSGPDEQGSGYAIVGPEHGTDTPATPWGDSTDEIDEILRQFLDDNKPSGASEPSAPIRKVLREVRRHAPNPYPQPPLPSPDCLHPFWVRFEDGRELGPLRPEALLRYVGTVQYIELLHVVVSADQVRWVSAARLMRLLGEALIANDSGMGQCTFLGTLKGHSLTAVLGELARTQASGRLVLLNDQAGQIDRRELHIRQGELTAISQNSATISLWQGLLASPFFCDYNLPESVYTAVRLQAPIRTLLSAQAKAGLRQARGLLARDQLRELYTWDQAHFGFDPTVEPLDGWSTPLYRLLPRMVARYRDPAAVRAAVAPYFDVPLQRSADFDEQVAAMQFSETELERIEPLGHGYTLGESLAQSALRDEGYALVVSYVLIELQLLKRSRSTSVHGRR